MSKEKSNKVKKPFYKKWWVWALAVVILVGIANSGEETATTEEEPAKTETVATKQEEPKEEPAPVEKEEKPAPPKEDPGISMEEFEEIQNGMTVEEVVKIIGGEGEIMSEVGEKGTSLYTVMYKYDGESGLGSNANVTFQGGKLQMKAQFGLN
jgi:predicted Zn-dependent peptidase